MVNDRSARAKSDKDHQHRGHQLPYAAAYLFRLLYFSFSLPPTHHLQQGVVLPFCNESTLEKSEKGIRDASLTAGASLPHLPEPPSVCPLSRLYTIPAARSRIWAILVPHCQQQEEGRTRNLACDRIASARRSIRSLRYHRERSGRVWEIIRGTSPPAPAPGNARRWALAHVFGAKASLVGVNGGLEAEYREPSQHGLQRALVELPADGQMFHVREGHRDLPDGGTRLWRAGSDPRRATSAGDARRASKRTW